MMVVVISTLACSIASLPRLHRSAVGQWVVIVGAPLLFITVLSAEFGMFVFRDGREFGFPLWVRAHGNAADFLATYIALGASYLIAREATRMPLRAVRVIGRIEVARFAFLGAFELFLLCLRVYVA
jgi:hypothetical protein